MKKPAAVLAIALLAASGIRAQQQTPAQFRGGTDIVAVDFYAVDTSGTPVLDLKPEELTLKVGKDQRPIRSLEFIRVAPGADVDTPMPAAERTPIAYGSNLPQDAGRMVFLVFDHEGMSPGDEQAAKTAIPAFLDQLSPRDRVALVTLPRGRVEVDLTTDRARLLAAIKDVTGHFAPPGPAEGLLASSRDSCTNAEQREGNDALVAFLDGIARLDGPKVVVFVSPGLVSSEAMTANCQYLYDQAAEAASAARAHVYGLVPHQFSNAAGTGGRVGSDGFLQASPTNLVVSEDSLGPLIAATGGEQFLLSASAANIFTRIARESSAYYLLSFDTTDNDRNGKSHAIALTTTRPGVTIRARPSFTVESAKDAAKHAPKPSVVGPVRGLLDDYTAHRDLPLRVAAYAFRDTAKTLRIVAATDIPGGGSLAQVDFGLFDGKSKGVTEWPAPKPALGKSEAVASATIAPGAYRLRVAASDEGGRVGAADLEFTAGLTKAGAYTLSDLMLGAIVGKDFVPRLSFGNDTGVTAYAELYGAMPASTKPTVAFEVADTMASAPHLSIPATLAPTKDADRWIVSATIPVDKLMPSDYVVRLVVRANGAEVGHVVRTLHKEIH
jgi:VWFA-related protein